MNFCFNYVFCFFCFFLYFYCLISNSIFIFIYVYIQVPEARLAAVSIIIDLCKKEEFLPKLENFIERFKARIVEMCRDVDEHVASQAVELCLLLLK